MKEYRDVFLDHLKAISAISNFGDTMADEFECLYNALYNAYTFDARAGSCGENEFDLFRLHVWELFVCTVTYMLHFELYDDIHDLLNHTYFLRISGLGSAQKPFCYEQFCFYSQMMEEYIKPTMEGELSRKFTLTGHYIYTEREYLPIYSGRALANADLFLYQVFNGLALEELVRWRAWFPTLYVYADEYDSLWKKLTSKRFCEKVMSVFGALSIQELKDRIAKCIPNTDYRHSGAWGGYASAILSWVKLDDVATLP